MYINGTWASAPANASFDVINPANGSVIKAVPDGGAEAARAASREAHDAW